MRNKARIVAAPAQHQSLGRILWQQHGRRAVIAANRRNATPALETFLARVELGHTPDIPDEELPRVDDGSHLPSKFEPVGVGLARLSQLKQKSQQYQRRVPKPKL